MKGYNALTAAAVSIIELTSLSFLKEFSGFQVIETKTVTNLYGDIVKLVGATTALDTAGQNFLGAGNPAISRVIGLSVLGLIDLGILIAVPEAGI